MSFNLHAVQAVSAVFLFFAARITERTVATEAASTIKPTMTYCIRSDISSALFGLEILLYKLRQLGGRRVSGIIGERQHGVASIFILAATKGSFSFHQMALSANWARNLLNAFQSWSTRLFGLLLPTRRRRLGLSRFALLDSDAADTVITLDIEDDLTYHFLEFVYELSGAVFTTFYLTQLFLPQTSK